MPEVGKQVREMPLKHLGDLDHGSEPTPGSPRIPVAEERSGALGVRVGPEPVELHL